MNTKIIRMIIGITVFVTCYNFSLSAQISEGGKYSLYFSVPYFETTTMNPIHGSYYLEGLYMNELIYSRLWTWDQYLSETSDLVSFDLWNKKNLANNMLIAPKLGDSLFSWKIKIRPNLKWPDGIPLTAEDIKFTFEVFRICHLLL